MRVVQYIFKKNMNDKNKNSSIKYQLIEYEAFFQ